MRKTAGVTLSSPATVLEPTRGARKTSQTDGVDHSRNPDVTTNPNRAVRPNSPIALPYQSYSCAVVALPWCKPRVNFSTRGDHWRTDSSE